MPKPEENFPDEFDAIVDPFRAVKPAVPNVLCRLPLAREYTDDELAEFVEHQFWLELEYEETDTKALKAYREFTRRSWRERGYVPARGYTHERMQKIRRQALHSMGLDVEGDD